MNERLEGVIDQASPEIFEVRAEELEALKTRSAFIYSNLTRGDRTHHYSAPIPKDNPWNLSEKSAFGSGTYENTTASFTQFTTALALSKSEIVDNLASVNRISNSNFRDSYFQQLSEAQILRGLKMIDLGCGHNPMVARMCRALGAQVYTADRFPSKGFEVAEDRKGSEQAIEESAYHIQVDLNKREALSIIESKTGGEFGFITESSFWEIDSPHKFNSLLRIGGVFLAKSEREELGTMTKEGFVLNNPNLR